MKIGPRKITAMVGALGMAIALIVSYQLGGSTALLAAVGTLQIVLLVAVLESRVALRRHSDRRTSDVVHEIVKLDHRVSRMDRSVESLGELTNSLRESQRRADERVDDLRRHTAGEVHEARKRITAHTRSTLNDQYRQIEALLALYNDTHPKESFPPLRTWVASPDLLHYVYRHVVNDRPGRVLELGSGVSTLVIAYALRHIGQGQLISLEHDEHYRDVTAGQLQRHGLEQWVDLRLAPLEPVNINDEWYEWYSAGALPTSRLDLLLVDGPPGNTQARARYPALPMTRTLLADNAVVVLDDYDRDDEKEIAAAWVEENPEFTLERVAHEKGTAILRAGD